MSCFRNSFSFISKRSPIRRTEAGTPPVTFRWYARLFTCAVLAALFFNDHCAAQDDIPGESQMGFLYAVTHLHWSLYVFFFLVFLASVLNLIVQGWIPLLSGTGRRFGRYRLGRPPAQDTDESGADAQAHEYELPYDAYDTEEEDPEEPDSPAEAPIEGVISTRRSAPVRRAEDIGPSEPSALPEKAPIHEAEAPPTPLEGVDHPWPGVSSARGPRSGRPKLVSEAPRPKPEAEFKFSAAVEIPTAEEVTRRDREKVVVSGCVLTEDGRGLESVLVYLVDAKGTRVGQSCRTVPETGEFRVQTHESGRYRLAAHKRGFIMAGAEAVDVPVESGKVEGLTVRMIPEGCTIRGRVFPAPEADLPPGLTARVVCDPGQLTRSGPVAETGAFSIGGTPHNSRCRVEITDKDGEITAVSKEFDTERRKELFRKVELGQTTETHDETSTDESHAHDADLSPEPTEERIDPGSTDEADS